MTTTSKPLATRLRFASLLLAALLLSSCGLSRVPKRASQAAETAAGPDGIARVLDVRGGRVVFEGLDDAEGAVFPDGRIWMLERSTGNVRLLSKPEDFGAYFFATGAALSPDGNSAYIKVNRTNDGDNLYRIDLRSGRAAFITDAAALGLVEIREESLLVSPDGRRLVFAAYRQERQDAGQNGENVDGRLGVYAMSLADPAGGLRLVRQEDGAGLGQVLVPYFGASGRLRVHVERLVPGEFPDQADAAVDVEDLRTMPLPALRRLEERSNRGG